MEYGVPMNNDYNSKIKQSRDAGFSDEEIFNKMKETPEFKEKYSASEKQGVSSKEIDNYVKNKYNLNFKPQKTFLQNAVSALSNNPITNTHSYLLEKAIGKNPISDTINEMRTALVSAPPAALMSLPNELFHGPENILKATEEFHKGEEPRKWYDPELRTITDPILKAADWFFDVSGLKEVSSHGPSFEEAISKFRQEEEAPRSHLGKAIERVGAGLGSAGPIGAFAGLADYIGEQSGMSPEQRAVMSLMVGKIQKGPKTIHGELLPKEPIESVNNLAARLIAYDPENINTQTMKAAYDLKMPIEQIPLQAIYKNGLPNLMEGISQNSFFGEKKFNKLLEDFTTDMTKRVDEIIDSVPIDDIGDITTREDIGEPKFDNFLPALIQASAPQLDIPKHQTGKVGTSALQIVHEKLTEDISNAYEQVQLTQKDILSPNDPEYFFISKGIKEARKKLESKGFKGSARKAALKVIDEVEDLYTNKVKTEFGKPIEGPPRPLESKFEIEDIGGYNYKRHGNEIPSYTKTKKTKIVPGEVIFEKEKKTPNVSWKERQPIQFSDIVKNLQDLNKTISYEQPGVMNLVMPIANAMRRVIQSAAERNPKLNSLVLANGKFAKKAEMFNDPLLNKLTNMTDEQFYRAVRNNPSYLKKFSDFAEKTGMTAELDDLKGRIIADVLEAPLKATTPKELVRSITDKVIKEMRELEPFYPEMKGMSKSLQETKKMAAQFETPEAQFKSKIRKEIFEDILSDSDFTSTLNRMNTPKGISLVRDALKNTKQGRSLLKTLERKKIEQALYNGPKTQEINLSDVAVAFENPKTDAILKTLLPAENYKQAQNLSKIAQQYEKGTKTNKGLKTKFEKGVGLGIVPAIFMAPVQTTLGVGTMAFYLTSKNFKKALIENAKKQYDLTVQPNNKKTKTNTNNP
jgi:hypothetical protein